MKKIVFLFLLLIGCSKNFNEKDLISLQIIDQNGFFETVSSRDRLKKYENIDFLSPQPYQKILRVYGKNKEGKSYSQITSYYRNGNIWQFLEALDTKAFGSYREWHPGGALKIEAKVIGGTADINYLSQSQWLFDGLCKAYSERGTLISSISYHEGILDGNSTYFYENGGIKEVVPYDMGKIEGDLVKYTEKGEIISKVHFEKGVREKYAFSFWADKKPAQLELYEKGCLKEGLYFAKDGKLLSEVKEGEGKKPLFREGKLHKFIEYKGGIREGKVICYDEKEKITRVFFIKSGKKQGEETIFHLNSSIPRLLISWERGNINGSVTTLYTTGQIETRRTLCQNKKHGPAQGWYRDGQLMFVEEYENDLLKEGNYFKKNQKESISMVKDGDGEVCLFDEKGTFLRKIKYKKGLPMLEDN